MSYFDEALMRSKIDACLQKVRMVADKDRASQIHSAYEVPHQYVDKFLLADTITNTMCASLVHCFSLIGLSRETLKSLKSWGAEKTVTLSFRYNRKTTFLREQEREVESPTRVQETSETSGTSTISVVTKVKEYVFLEEQIHQLVAFSGVGDDAEEFFTVLDRSGSTERTSTYRSENSESTRNHDLDLSWLLIVLSEETNVALFAIDRSHVDCFTPAQNRDIEEATKFGRRLRDFGSNLYNLIGQWKAIQRNGKFVVSSSSADYSPVVPLFEASNELGAAPMSSEVINALLSEYQKHLVRICAEAETAALSLHEAASTTPALFGPDEAKLQRAMYAVYDNCHSYLLSIDFLENMIRKQLVAAIGKTVSAQDFAQYMTFHNRKVFKEAYQPQPFSYAVRRSPVHSPEGQIQIETVNVTPAEPIYTVSQHVENAPHMEFALNATTTVQFGGERHLHGWMEHRFSGQAMPQLKLVAEARQFSSYIVLIGRIASATLFQPKHGFIIPTAKEFKDAISSLSSEQQRFAKAFRSMQLESTLFGVCVIQIKPQLEKYQIPTDLLSYQGQGQQEGGGEAELTAVKGHAQALQEVLLSAKEEEVAEAELQRGLKRSREEEEDEMEESDGDEEQEEGEGEGRDGDGRDVRFFARFSKGGNAPRKTVATARASSGGKAPTESSKRRKDGSCFKSRMPSPPIQPSAKKHVTCISADLVHQLSIEPEQSSRALDFTAYPTKLEEMYTQYDPDSSL
eukprot:gene16131-18415_t